MEIFTICVVIIVSNPFISMLHSNSHYLIKSTLNNRYKMDTESIQSEISSSLACKMLEHLYVGNASI